jgi:hypothetical protein
MTGFGTELESPADRELLAAADRGDLTQDDSRLYLRDGRPVGPVTASRIESLLDRRYLTFDPSGSAVTPTGKGREALA